MNSGTQASPGKDLAALQSQVLAMQSKARSRKEENRARMPKVAAFVDVMKEAFGDGVKVLYAKENGYEVGTMQRHDWISPSLPYRPAEKTKKR